MKVCWLVIALVTGIVLLGFISPKSTQAQVSKTYNISPPSSSTFYGPFLGFGAEWDPFFWNTNNLNRGTNQASWQLNTNRIKELDVGIVRMMMQLYWAQSDPNLTRWDWSNPQMQSVFKYLDFACSNNITVILTDWGWAIRPSIGGHLYSTPTDIRYARGVAEYLKEFIERRGYSCIKYLILGNEPDNEIQKDAGMSAYVTMYKNVDQALRDNGMRSRIKLTGPDMGGQWDFMKNAVTELKGVLDTYDFHRYASTNETSNLSLPGTWESLWSHLDMWRTEVNNRDNAAASKQLLLTEMGNSGGGTNDHPLIDTFEYALHMADYGTTLLTTRVNTGIAWTMHDIYYFDGGQYMKWGMWKYLDQSWAIRPWGQAFGLLIKHAKPGSILSSVNNTPPSTPALSQQRVAALKRPDGSWALFLINREATNVNISVNLPTLPTKNFTKYYFDRNTHAKYTTQIALPSEGIVTASKSLTLTLPAESFTVLVEGATSISCPTDINNDLITDISDYSLLVSNFMQSPPANPRSDINSDGMVDLSDYSLLVAKFMQPCV